MMLKANVGISRKISRDYQSTGYTVNIEGEILATVDDPEAVLGRIKELFSLANEALSVEIDRDQGEDSIGRRDEKRPQHSQPQNGQERREPIRPSQRPTPESGTDQRNDEAITNKQAQYLHSLAKKHRLSASALEDEIERVTGRRRGVYDITKREAGKVIDSLQVSVLPG